MSLNVVQLVSNPVWGGGEQYVLDLCKALRDAGHSVAVVTRGKQAVDSRFRAEGFTPGKLPLRGRLDIFSPIVLARVLNRMEAPVVLHVHNFKDADTAVRARRLMQNPGKVRVVLTRHLVKAAGTSRYHKELYAAIDAMIFVSETARREFLSSRPAVDASRLHVVPNSVSVRRAEPLQVPAGERRIVYVGRIAAEKGIDVLIKAFAKLSDIAGLRLVIAGTGRGRDVMPLMELARRLGVDSRLDWAGQVADVAPLMASAEIGVLPSVGKEAFGLVVAEFMAQGVPVVATGHGACAEIITDGVDGLLVPPSDVDALADAIRRLASDSELRDRLGRAGALTVATRFAYDCFYRSIESIYNSTSL
ncbi:MAG: glycosyltransferase family 4 protein [Muribaculaceae bacterium]|nr:glycosyltransferase family 4 protein [Muribaculaceae bacterium]